MIGENIQPGEDGAEEYKVVYETLSETETQFKKLHIWKVLLL